MKVFQASVTLYIETNDLTWSANQIIGYYMMYNNGL